MKTIYQNFLNLYTSEQFDAACEEFKNAESLLKPSASLLVKKGISIQLSSEACPYSLEEAERAFKCAIEEDSNCTEAYIELGHYYLEVQSDPDQAQSYFNKAFEISCKSASEALCGTVLCISEIQSPQIALEYLKKRDRLIWDKEMLEKTIASLHEEL